MGLAWLPISCKRRLRRCEPELAQQRRPVSDRQLGKTSDLVTGQFWQTLDYSLPFTKSHHVGNRYAPATSQRADGLVY